MKFLFIGQGYPNVPGTTAGSGIGTYLREITLGLVAQGHECHVIVWQGGDGGRWKVGGGRKTVEPSPMPDGRGLSTAHYSPADGILVYRLPHAYWPWVEQAMPDSRDVWNLRRFVRQLDTEHRYDRIEIQSEEGIAIGVQKTCAGRVLLRVHTTLQHMVEIKEMGEGGRWKVGGGGEESTTDNRQPITINHASPAALPWQTRYRLWRERRSFYLAPRIITSSRMHAEELKARFPGIAEPAVVCLGIGGAEEGGRWEVGGGRVGINSHQPSTINHAPRPPSFLLVGSMDRRKGFDRLRPILDAYAAAYGPCRTVIVTTGGTAMKDTLGLERDASGWTVDWRYDLADAHLAAEYSQADVFLHLARYESFGLPLIEAAAAGTPVVSTRVGVAPELLAGELADCIVDGDDAGAVAAVLHGVVSRRAGLGQEIFKRYRARFTRALMTTNWLACAQASERGARFGAGVSGGLREDMGQA